MMKNKKCAICGYKFSFDDKVYENPYVQPHDDGARYYYDLWHFFIEQCPNCGYASKDVAHTFNKKIIEDSGYNDIYKIDIIRELDGARPNRAGAYLKGAHYYNSIGSDMNEIKSLLQAGDVVYGELLYWDDYIFDHSTSTSALISKTQANEIMKFADSITNSAITKLEKFILENPEDYDAQILLAGTLSDGDKIQQIKSAKILNALKNKDLSTSQKKTIKFLLDQMK